MALINCPECGKQISDKAVSCPNCGCPMVKKNHCIINGVDVDCSFVLDKSPEYDAEMKELIMLEKTGLSLDIIGRIVEDWSKKGEIPPVFNGKTETTDEYYDRMLKNASSRDLNKPHCPTCGSTDISKISAMSKAGSVFWFGLLSQKVKKTFHCNNCKYEW